MLQTDLATRQQLQIWFVVLVCLTAVTAIFFIERYSRIEAVKHSEYAKIQYFVDASNSLSFEDMIRQPEQSWQVEERSVLSYGIAAPTHWFKFKLPNEYQQGGLVEIDYALLDHIDLWFVQDGIAISRYSTGDKKPFEQRPIAYKNFLFPMPQHSQPVWVWIKVNTKGSLKVPIYLKGVDEFQVHNNNINFYMGAYFGLLMAMMGLNLFFFVATGIHSHLYYFAFVGCLSLSLATLHGYSYQYLWPASPWFQSKAVPFFINATALFRILFAIHLIQFKTYSYLAFKFLMGCAALFFVNFIVSPFLPYATALYLTLPMLIGISVVFFIMTYWVWVNNIHIGKLYTLSWVVLTVAVFFTGMDNLNLLNLAIPSHYLLLIGSAVESFLLAGVIAMNAGEKSRELVLIQQKALEIEREARAAQEETLQIQHETRQELEYKVQERTLELQIALRELSETNSELEKLNTFDALTGIRNRGYFDKKFQAEARLSRREHTNLCLIMLDIDHFKAINDTFGHIAGDKCIQFVAEILRSNINRPRDEAFRYGGEEFAVLLPNTSIKGAKSIAEQIRHQVEHTEVSTSEGSVSMTISAGVSSGIIIGIDQEALLLEQADKALYEAKHSGRNKVCLFNADTADT